MLFDHTAQNLPSPPHAVDGGPVPAMSMHDMSGHYGNSNPRLQVWHTLALLRDLFVMGPPSLKHALARLFTISVCHLRDTPA